MIYHANFTKPNNGYKTFGGLISLSDFDTSRKKKTTPNGSIIARRIIADHCFDEQCRKKIENIQNGQENGKRI